MWMECSSAKCCSALTVEQLHWRQFASRRVFRKSRQANLPPVSRLQRPTSSFPLTLACGHEFDLQFATRLFFADE